MRERRVRLLRPPVFSNDNSMAAGIAPVSFMSSPLCVLCLSRHVLLNNFALVLSKGCILGLTSIWDSCFLCLLKTHVASFQIIAYSAGKRIIAASSTISGFPG